MRVGTSFFQQFMQGSGAAAAQKPAIADPAADRIARMAPGVMQTEQQELRGVRENQLNVSTALSFSGAAQNYLGEIRDRLESLGNLARRAKDPSLPAEARQVLQAQAGKFPGELESLASTTRHNGRKLFDGSLNNIILQTGPAPNDREILSLPSMRPSILGARAIVTPEPAVDDQPLAAAEVRLNAVAVPASADSGAPAKAAAINKVADQTGVHAHAMQTVLRAQSAVQSAYLDGASSALTINGVNIGGVVVSPGDANGSLRNAIERHAESTGVSPSVDGVGRLMLSAQDGRTLHVRATGGAARDLGFVLDRQGEATAAGRVALSGGAAFTLSDPSGRLGTPIVLQTVQLDLTTSIEFTNLADPTSAQDATTSVETALARVDKTRTRLDGIQRQLGAFNATLARQSETIGGVEELQIKRSEGALETARQMQAQIMRDGAASFQAQANVTPRRALELLRA